MRDGAAARAVAGEEETLALLLPEIGRMLAREVRSDAIDRDACIPPRVREAAGALGLFGVTIPEEHGGAGLSLAGACRVAAELARVDRSVAVMIGLHVGLGTRALVTRGAPELQRKWLPRLASGECIASFCATEANAGSDLMSIRTTGTRVAGGLCVSGEKSYVTNGGYAGLFTALVRTPGFGGARAHALVCVPRDARGVSFGAEEHKMGIRGTSTVTVRFDDVVVPLGNVLGAPGEGMQIAHEALTWGRTLMASGCVGTARAALDAAIAYARLRRQFGKPIVEFGATRAHLAWMAARVHAMTALVQKVAEAQGRGDPIEIESAMAKVFASDSAFEVCDRALQLHGATGFLEGAGISRMLRDCRVTRIFEGANDVLLVRIGAACVGRPPRSPRTTGHDAVDALAARLEAAVAEVRARLGIAALRKQLVLHALARAEVALAAALAALDRAGDDAPLAAHAADVLARDGERALDDLARAERDEVSMTFVTDRLAP